MESERRTSLPPFFLKEMRETTSEFSEDFDPTAGFSRDELIEIRAREARILETDMAPYVRKLGFDDVRVVIGDLEISPFIEICGYRLTAEEASELIRRLSPAWDGQSCERGWETLPDMPALQPPPPSRPRHKPRPKKKQEKRIEAPPARRRKLGGFPRRLNQG